MKAGSLNIIFFILVVIFFSTNLFSEEKVILENLEPTFEEEFSETDSTQVTDKISKIKSKNKKKLGTKETVVRLRALDKITAKTSDINVIVGQKKKFGYLEIFPKKCAKSQEEGGQGVVAYIQVKDLSDKKDDKIFIFNGWTFSSSPTLRTFDHPVYDLWVTGCENI
tara:strand:+ start:1308 stop:1808 length:501 start_codon:yes stop_codon:yes gene_type:complete